MRGVHWKVAGAGSTLAALFVVTLMLPAASALGAPATHAGPSVVPKLHPWVSLTASAGTAPPARQAFGMAYDPDLKATVVFGGQDSGGGALGDTWEFVHGVWKFLNVSSPNAPSARWAPGLVYDPSLHGLLLFGGQDNYISIYGASAAFNDTWLFNSTGWHNISTAVAPEVMPASTMVYDSHDGYVVLFGSPAATNGYRNVWRYTAASGWSNITGRLRSVIPALGMTTVVDDPFDGYVLLFGGDNGCSGAGITWTYVAGSYHNITARQTATPTAKMGSRASSYDPNEQGVVMTGGYDASCNVINQTWLFHGGYWRNVSTATGTLIPGRWDGRMVFDAKIGKLGANLVFSGNERATGGIASLGSDTWKLAP